ncbi:class I adenylate-forming enzyme family protein [Gordonia sp. NPDC003424]
MSTAESIDQAVRRHASERPQAPAFIDPQRSLTWADLDASADRCAGLLADLGVGPGDRIGYLGPNTVAYPLTLLGAWRRGASIVGLNFRLPADGLRRVTEEVALAHVVVDARFTDVADRLSVGGVTVVDSGAQWPAADQAPAATVDPHDDDEALVYFTSGSTGNPKGVPLTRRAVEATIPYADVHHFTPDSRALVIPPTFHAAGATWANYACAIGFTTVYTDDASPAGIARSLAEYDITHTLMVPTLIHALLDELKRHPRDLTSLQHIGYGAAPITQHLLHEAIDILGCEFCQVYGLSESGGGVAFLLADDHVGASPRHLASAGRPGIGVDVEVRDATGRPLAVGTSGELWFRAPTLTEGYLNSPEASREVIVDGWLNTRDVGFVDDEGYIFVQGRADDMIQTGGENVHPQVVEEVIAAMPGIVECAVFGTSDPHWGQRVTAAIVTDREITDSDLIAWCRSRLAGYQVPKTVVILDALPRTATGKVQRKALAGLAASAPAG